VWHELGVAELNGGTNPKVVLTTMFVFFFGVFGMSTLTFPDKILLNIIAALAFIWVSVSHRDIFYDASRACPECDPCCTGRWDTPDKAWTLLMTPWEVVSLFTHLIFCGGTNAYRAARASRRGAAAAKIRALQVEQGKIATQQLRRRSTFVGGENRQTTDVHLLDGTAA
jgi:hypothetical protein